MAAARPGSFEEWLAKVEDDVSEKLEAERERKATAAAERERRREASEGTFDTWVQNKTHRANAIKVCTTQGHFCFS